MKYLKIKAIVFFLFIGLGSVHSQIPCSSGIFLSEDYNTTIPNTDAINLQNTRNRTIEFWFKPVDVNTMDKQVIYEEGGNVRAIYFYLQGGRIYLGAYRDKASEGNRRLFRSEVLDANTWYHVAFSIQGNPQPENFNGLSDDQKKRVSMKRK
jgi:hypothetical protein